MIKTIAIPMTCVILLVLGYVVYNYHFYSPKNYEDCLEHKRFPLMSNADLQIINRLCQRYPRANAAQDEAARIAAQQEAERIKMAEAKKYELFQIEFNKKISTIHPDWDIIVRSPSFHRWIEFYPDIIIKSRLKTAYKQGSAEDIIWMITRYKTELQQGRRPNKASNFFANTNPFGDLLPRNR